MTKLEKGHNTLGPSFLSKNGGSSLAAVRKDNGETGYIVLKHHQKSAKSSFDKVHLEKELGAIKEEIRSLNETLKQKLAIQQALKSFIEATD